MFFNAYTDLCLHFPFCILQCNDYFKIKTYCIKPQVIISSVTLSLYHNTTYLTQRTAAYLTTCLQSQPGQHHRGCLTCMNSEYFQDKPITVQQMTHSISLHTEFIGVCAHQREGGEAGRKDGAGT